jgi:riboflavin kinase/FMN adenylyltransferase
VSDLTPPTDGGLAALAPVARVITIGAFDGVHRGHHYLLGRVVARGRERSLATLAVTFEPPPAMVLRPDRFLGRLGAPDEKMAHLVASGVDQVVTIAFTRELAAQSPEEFMERLAATTRLVELWVGEGFALGRNRTGDIPRLTEIGHELGFTVHALPRIGLGEEPISSSEIRTAVVSGDAAKARRLLGRPFRVGGEVIHGGGIGRTIGFPTANIVPSPELVALADGIYASWAWLPDEVVPRPAMTYVGTRPTINTGPRQIETHLLDFDADLYGLTLRVDILERLRADQTFASVAALVAQLREDERAARAVLATLTKERRSRQPG